ncbi:hypothetical protein LEP1GSC161_1976 [Leptospira santarosai str. CBC1416]|uniref:Uncharacterized protein n=1 Tax=Leptospira santarosai str. CBC1416 TaxID=1193059 RepID=M6W105_9LEPT|nr:hypothetical protein LEP1GSC161_1976 [Leptospira santarosai str. CBC1416]
MNSQWKIRNKPYEVFSEREKPERSFSGFDFGTIELGIDFRTYRNIRIRSV